MIDITDKYTQEYKEKGIVGLNYLLKYINDPRSNYLDVVKNNTREIRFWMLLTFLSNNYTEIDNIPESLLERLFNKDKIRHTKTFLEYDDGGVYDFGNGIKSNGRDLGLSYAKEFKIIRNALAHKNFSINEDDSISIYFKDSKYKAVMDLKWLESVVTCCLANHDQEFKKDLSSYIIVGTVKEDEKSKSQVLDSILGEYLKLLKITLNTNNKDRIRRSLDSSGIRIGSDELSFAFIKDAIHYTLTSELNNRVKDEDFKNPQKFNKELMAVIKDINGLFKGDVTIAIEPIVKSKLDELIKQEGFNDVDAQMQMNLVVDYLASEEKVRKNAITYKYSLEFLSRLNKGKEIPKWLDVGMNFAKEFILSSLGYTIYNAVISSLPGYKTINEKVSKDNDEKYEQDFGHLKNVVKDDTKRILRTVLDLDNYGDNYPAASSWQDQLGSRYDKLDETSQMLEEGTYKPLLFSTLRNAFTHGFVSVRDEKVHLYDKEKKKYYPDYSKKKDEWTVFCDDKCEIINNINISMDDLLRIFEDTCKGFDLPFNVNIAKYCKRKDYLK
jgi:hypothetical protein